MTPSALKIGKLLCLAAWIVIINHLACKNLSAFFAFSLAELYTLCMEDRTIRSQGDNGLIP